MFESHEIERERERASHRPHTFPLVFAAVGSQSVKTDSEWLRQLMPEGIRFGVSALDSSPLAYLMWQSGSADGKLRHVGLCSTSAAKLEHRMMTIPEFLLEVSIVVMAVVSVVTNMSVLLCFTQSSELRSHVPGVFVLNLSFSNILLAFINMPSTFFGVAKSGEPFGNLFCQLVGFVETFLTTNSMLSMAALSLDRWIAVMFPLSYSSKMRYRDAILMVLYSWLQSLTFSLTQLLMDWGGYSPTYASCTVHLATEGRSQLAAYATFTVLLHCSSFTFSLAVLCFSYLKVLRVAKSHCKRIDVITVQTLLLLVDIHPSVKERCLAEQKKRRQRATKKICIFIGSFVFCYSPYVITRLVELLPSVHIPQYWGITTKCLCYAKASSDPFVYCLLRHQYRKVLIRIIGCFLRKDHYLLSASSWSSTFDTTEDNCARTT